MKIEHHWLVQAEKIISENCDDRPFETDISLLVIHCISLPPNQFGGDYIKQLFCNQLNADQHPYFKQLAQLKVSAHVLINRRGHISQFVPFNKRAWHAGVSNYQGHAKCNDFSIGIELEGTETEDYTEQQYHQLSSVINSLLKRYPTLSEQHIVGHSDIAPGRKTDPGDHFLWEKIIRKRQQ